VIDSHPDSPNLTILKKNQSNYIKTYLRNFMKEIKTCFRIFLIILQPTEPSIKTPETIDFNTPFMSIFNVTSFGINQGAYYESYGEVRTSAGIW